jgi:crotonobetainyl-CoA:carnitine CoA-transferase CaiB-like acyl-CoA transferase
MTVDLLAGLHVVEMASGLGALTTGALLAGLGAEVSQILPPGAPPADGPLRTWADRGKTASGLDAERPAERAEVRRLCAEADVFVSDLPPGQLERWGLDHLTLHTRRPDTVHVWLPAYGPAGRWSPLPYDPLLLAAVSGYADHYPSDLDYPIATVVPTFSYLHGAIGAAAAVAGLIGRQRDGRGRVATVTGLHATGAALASLMVHSLEGNQVISAGRALRGGPFFRLYQAGDGSWFYLAALSPNIFFRALDAIGRMDVMVREDVAGEFARLLLPEVSDAVNTELEQTFAQKGRDEWLSIFEAANVPAAAVWSRHQWMTSDLAAAVTGWEDSSGGGRGPVRTPAFPITFAEEPVGPARGDHVPPANSEPDPAGGAYDVVPDPDDPPELPLEGLQVMDISTYFAAPFSAALLADFGARVVKLEPPDGDPYRVHSISHAVVNQHKLSAVLKLRDETDRTTFLGLLDRYDVMVDNLRDGALERLGLDDEAIRRAHPDLVRASVSAFGTGNRWSTMPGFDPVLQSITGLAAAQGGDGRPSPSTAPVVDAATGALAALGVLTALFARGRDGRARRVRTSLAAGAVFVQSAEMTSYRDRPPAPTGGPEFVGDDIHHRFYRTEDGWLAVAAYHPEASRRFDQLVGADPETAMAKESNASWLDRLTAADVPAVAVARKSRAILDATLRANAKVATLAVPDLGRFLVVGSYGVWDGTPGRPSRAVPLGADSEEVLGRRTDL